ncbi:MAG: imidazoleglycerol-phosphate dehydratase HisB [Nitrospinaceae bacterium]|jgi:imidazoleglycerol-phosphate dehydratase|nr:MAG: imidazoleglycerol-phosphate dehydratase HisB [Nitrospinaceae bacterium]
MGRTAKIQRTTSETEIDVGFGIDGTGTQDLQTTIPFLDHMLSQLARHGHFDLKVQARGDTHIDFHHTVEDVGITLGQAFKQALGDKRGIRRFARASVPLNEALAHCVIDISGRSYFVFNADLPKAKIGEFDVELVAEFFQAFAANSGITLHFDAPYWTNLHHIVEAMFKAFARALDEASCLDARMGGVPSTKGKL